MVIIIIRCDFFVLVHHKSQYQIITVQKIIYDAVYFYSYFCGSVTSSGLNVGAPEAGDFKAVFFLFSLGRNREC